jgi:hypothetical protein
MKNHKWKGKEMSEAIEAAPEVHESEAPVLDIAVQEQPEQPKVTAEEAVKILQHGLHHVTQLLQQLPQCELTPVADNMINMASFIVGRYIAPLCQTPVDVQ